MEKSEGGKEESSVAQALKLWASQEDPLMDLECMASEWMSGGTGWSVPNREQFARHFNAESKRAPVELSAARTRTWMDVGSINSSLLRQESRAIRSGRRAWAQALALAGCVDFGPSWDDAPKGFDHIAGLAACWYWTRSPLLNEGVRQTGKRPLGDQIDEQQQLVCDQALASAIRAGHDLGLENPEVNIKAHMSALPMPTGMPMGFQARDKIELACVLVDRAAVELGARKPVAGQARKPRL